jgi:hypothetical protein
MWPWEKQMLTPNQKRPEFQEAEFKSLLSNLFRRAGLSICQQQARDSGVDIVVDSGDKHYVIEVKRAAEGRGDRLIPLLSQVILQVQTAAQQFSIPAIPVAIVAAPQIPNSVAQQVKQFAMRYAPGVGIGLLDSEGLRVFQGFGLEKFNSERLASASLALPGHDQSTAHLFSDAYQWMLKILLAPSIPESLLSAPRGQYQNGSQLARAAGVSPMTASRFIRHLSKEGFLDERSDWLRLVRIKDLMQRWSSASRGSAAEIPVRWIIPGDKNQLSSAVQSYVSWTEARSVKRRKSLKRRLIGDDPRICIGLFAAAGSLGVGFAHGIAQHLYLERSEPAALEQLGLSVENAERRPDVLIRIPRNEETVFRPVVRCGGAPVSDILQVWLDVSNHPAGGKEQADEIWKRALSTFLFRRRRVRRNESPKFLGAERVLHTN